MKISVIIPVYNSEKYVRRCIDSVIAQTYQNWEMILVDDGSVDNSLAILQEYENKDTRVNVVHQDNAGPGSARNTGIACATGEYIVFIDSDDRVNKEYFRKLSMKKEDVVFIDVNQVDEKFRLLKSEQMSSYRGLSKDRFLRQQMTGKINWGGGTKSSQKKIIIK